MLQLTRRERIIIVGCGRLGGRIATMLSDRGYQVVVIDNRPEAFNKLPESFGGFTIVADGIDLDTLKYADCDEAAVFVASTGNDNMNSLLAQIASRIFSVPNVYARFDDVDKGRLVKGFNIQSIYPFKLSLIDFEEHLFGRGEYIDELEDEEEDV